MTEKKGMSVADYFNYILSVGPGWDVWLVEDEDGEYILVDNFAAPPANVREILAIAASEEDARRIAESEAKRRNLKIRFEDTHYYSSDDFDEEYEL